MTPKTVTPAFRVIEGGACVGSRGGDVGLPEPLAPCAAELAADMAELFALGLVQDMRPEAVLDPHCAVRLDGATRFTMHEILCELRNLSWFDARSPLDPGGDAARRRASRLNGDGQLTLCALMRGGAVLRSGGDVLSALWQMDHQVAEEVAPAETCPDEEAPMSEWLNWCARQSLAGLRLPGGGRVALPSQTLGARAEELHRMAPARPFHNAVLVALARGTRLEPGLPGDGRWGGTRLMALMAEAESRAGGLAQLQAARPGRLARPAVTAARMTVWLASGRPDRGTPPMVAKAAEELAAAAPELLDWVHRANRARRGPQRFERSLFLPLAGPDRQYLNPSDVASHVVVAGALATLVKAVFDTSRQTQLQSVGVAGQPLSLEDQVDRLAANIAMLRSVTGGYFAAENWQDLRLGEAIALDLLRGVLERDNRSATLGLRDFDGRSLVMQAHPRVSGRGMVALLRDGAAAPWPRERRRATARLTAVV